MKELSEKNVATSRGITLIALVITIIVMLILVAVTISIAINEGLFNYTEKATGDYLNKKPLENQQDNGAQIQEKIIDFDGYYLVANDYLDTDFSVSKSGVNINFVTEALYEMLAQQLDEETLNKITLTDEELFLQTECDGWGYDSFEDLMKKTKENGEIDEEYSTLKEFLQHYDWEETGNLIDTDEKYDTFVKSMRNKVKDYKDFFNSSLEIITPDVNAKTDEELFIYFFQVMSNGQFQYESFEDFIKYGIESGEIDKEYSTLKELSKNYDLFDTGDSIDTDEEYDEFMKELKRNLPISIYDMGDYIFSVKISAEEKFKLKITIDKYGIIENNDLYGIYAYDFENDEFLGVNNASYILNGQAEDLDSNIYEENGIKYVEPNIANGMYYFTLTCEANNIKVDGYAFYVEQRYPV